MPKRVDANQAEIRDALRMAGASVLHLHTIGGGAPDLLVGFRGDNFLLEIKFGDGKLNEAQIAWHTLWRGQVGTVRTVDEAFEAIGVDTGKAQWDSRSALRDSGVDFDIS